MKNLWKNLRRFPEWPPWTLTGFFNWALMVMMEQLVEYYPVGWNLYCYLVNPRLWFVTNGRPSCAMYGCMWPALCCDWLRVEHPTLWLVSHSSETLGVKAADFHFLYIFYGLYVMWLCVQQKKCSHAPIKNQSSLNIVSPSFNLHKAHQLQVQCMYTKHSIHLLSVGFVKKEVGSALPGGTHNRGGGANLNFPYSSI